MNYKRQKHESLQVYQDRIERLVQSEAQRQNIFLIQVLEELNQLRVNVSPKYFLDKEYR